MAEITTDIDRACEYLAAGELVAIPTETVYGLAGNALDVNAVAAVFDAKQRPSFDPLIIHVPGLSAARRYVQSIPAPLAALAEAFWPGPLTLLLARKDIIPDLVTAGLSRVAVRVPAHPLTQRLLGSLDFPLAAPSANPFGYISPTRPDHVQAQLGDRVRAILDGGPSEIGLESTIVGMEGDDLVVYRLGGLAVDEIESVVGPVSVRTHSTSNPAAPGQLARHYSPGTPFVLGDRRVLCDRFLAEGRKVGSLGFTDALPEIPAHRQRVLSANADLAEAASNLFTALRELDAMDVDIIVAELLPERGLGLAINDRLRRAAAKSSQ